MSKRLFIGLELPTVCRETLSELVPRMKGVKPVREEQIHLTMSFLGHIEAARETALREALSEVEVPPFFLPIRGLGTFGGQRPTVFWAGVGKGHPHLFALHKHVQDAVLHAGLEADLRPFHPHITIARLQGLSAASLRPLLRKHEESEFGLWEVRDFVLFSSVLSAEGATYHVEMRRKFEASGVRSGGAGS
jgi:2'-5' RNA ligase